MTSNDVRAILNLATLPASNIAGPSRRVNPTVRRPDGISRELYALIGDNAPSLAQAQASAANVKYKDRPKALQKKSRWYAGDRVFD